MSSTVRGEKGETMTEWIIQAETVGNISDGYWYSNGEEIVRCKDCKHNSLNRMSGNTYCDIGIGLYQLNDFCSKGERKDDEPEN